MNRSVLITSMIAILFISIVSTIIIFFARGYTFNPRSGAIQKTGWMIVTSEPRDAAIYLNEKLKDTTNATLPYLSPGKYKVRVTKEGFTPWEKEVEVRAELVTRLDVTLFPQVPDPRRLTFVGVESVYPTQDNSKVVYRVTEKTKTGLWVTSLSDRLPFVNQDSIQIYKDDGQINLEEAEYLLSPDNKTLLLVDNSRPTPTYFLLDTERINESLVAQRESDIESLLINWHDSLYSKEKNLRQKLVESTKDIPPYENPNPNLAPVLADVDKILEEAAIIPLLPTPSPSQTTNAAQASRTPGTSIAVNAQNPQEIIKKIQYLLAHNRWSPKQDKVMYEYDGTQWAYDLTTGKSYTLPKAESTAWLPTDAHLILINPNGKKGEIAVVDYDGTNQVVIFSGQFVDNIAIPWTNGTKIVVLTNLNQAAGTQPNLYAINLR